MEAKQNKGSFKLKHYINYIVVFCAFALFTALYYAGALNRSMPTLLNQIGYSVILAVSLNLVVGFLGELSLGHAGFMCIGAYLGTFMANLFLELGLGVVPALLISMLIGGVAAGVFGFVVGLPALRLRGDYLAIVTLAFGEIIRNVCKNMPFFGGAQGLVSQIAKTNLGKNAFPLFVISFAFVLVMLFLVQNLIRSKHGRAITAIRDNEIAAKAMGINVTYYKLFIFIVSAVFAGVAGAIYGAGLTPVEYSAFSYNYSIEILVMVVLGGMGSIGGSIASATAITVINNFLKANLEGDMAAIKTLIYALILILIVVYKNAPALKSFREKYDLKKMVAQLIRKKISPSTVNDDNAEWDVIPTKIEMNEILSTDLIVTESTMAPDKEDGNG